MAQKENGELCQSPVAHLPILFDVHGGSFRDRRGKLPSASWNVCVVGIIFKWKNLYFCQQICCLLCCEYWIMVTQTTDSTGEKSGWETLRFIYFLINWIFPFEKHETSLGIFGVKPEVFHFFGRFLFTLSIEVLFFHPGDDKIDSCGVRRRVAEEKHSVKNSRKPHRIFIDDDIPSDEV